jgi:hypothetical protein
LLIINCGQLACVAKWFAIPVDTGGILVDPGVTLLLQVSLPVAVTALDGGHVPAGFAFTSFSFGAGKLTGSPEGLYSGFCSSGIDHFDHEFIQVFTIVAKSLLSMSARFAILFLVPLDSLINSKLMASCMASVSVSGCFYICMTLMAWYTPMRKHPLARALIITRHSFSLA